MVWVKLLALIFMAVVPYTTASPEINPRFHTILSLADLEYEDKYVVGLQNNLSPTDLKKHLLRVSAVQYRNKNTTFEGGTGVRKTYAIGDYRAYSAVLDRDTIKEIWNDTVEKPPWGLATLSNKKPHGFLYRYDKSAGEGTFAYVLDTGINTKHVDFEGRASMGFNPPETEPTDINGHGTHVAGIIGGKTFGVAKKTQLIGVKVFLDDEATTSTLLEGLEWAVNDIRSKSRQSRSVINLSLGGPYSEALNRAVNHISDIGILPVVAAGNEGIPATFFSPASADRVLTVGAINSDWQETNFSNFGPQVNILAPGQDILSAYISTSRATRVLSGTSMAAPHVAGLALYLMALEDFDSTKKLMDRILQLGKKDKVVNLMTDSPNLIVHNNVK
ncbi:serine protease [Trichoderma citrinoviride]|uniref:Serine protease n=1 Tax=Trichoderma citrinoviride TaxID=58853 RepID=A0A2T4BFP9_9HYPO|nr:serine protease [Trichoderma citrinoviride]PTB68142.1 serine protease [Trichoderma citrinoviride]